MCSPVDGIRAYHTKWNNSERETEMPHGISYVWTLKYNINETVYGTEKDLQRQKTEQTPGCQGGGWERNAVGVWG